MAQLEFGAPGNVPGGEADDGTGAIEPVEEVDDAFEDAAIVGAERLGEAGKVSLGHAVNSGGGGVGAGEPQGVFEDAGVGAAVDLNAVETGEAEFVGEGIGDSVATRAAARDEGAVDVEEEEAHRRQCSPRGSQGQVVVVEEGSGTVGAWLRFRRYGHWSSGGLRGGRCWRG